jgi:mono/diheme cytochrome c family protein
MKPRLLLIVTTIVVAVLLLLALSSVAVAQRYAPGPGAPEGLFIERCATCHGASDGIPVGP